MTSRFLVLGSPGDGRRVEWLTVKTLSEPAFTWDQIRGLSGLRRCTGRASSARCVRRDRDDGPHVGDPDLRSSQ